MCLRRRRYGVLLDRREYPLKQSGGHRSDMSQKPTLIVIDGFHRDPLALRQRVIQQRFERPGGSSAFNGFRLRPTAVQAKRWIQRLERDLRCEISCDLRLQGHFKALTHAHEAQKTSRVHTDPYEWSAVVCLMSPSMATGCTSFWRHRVFGIEGLHNPTEIAAACARHRLSRDELIRQCTADSNELSKWEEVTCVRYKFNRLIMFKGSLFHVAGAGFGTSIKTAKLIQTFFFDASF